MVTESQSDVRSKPEEKKKGKYSLSLGKDTFEALTKAAEKDGRTVSAMADRLLRKGLELDGDEPADGGS